MNDTRPWVHAAACRGMDSDIFYPLDETKAVHTAPARAICNACPVWFECLTEAVERERGTGDRYGVFGGYTGAERAELVATPVDVLIERHAATAHLRPVRHTVKIRKYPDKPSTVPQAPAQSAGECKVCHGLVDMTNSALDPRARAHDDDSTGEKCSGSGRRVIANTVVAV